MPEECDHNWQPGDIHSDWICSECSERSNIPDYPDEPETCRATYTTGGHDSYGTGCGLAAGHAGKHSGANPFGGNGRVLWNGGGYCAGDPLPYRNVEWVD